MDSEFADKSSSANYTNVVEAARFFCCFRWCCAGPFTEAALWAHLSQHKRPALARKLVSYITREAKQ